MVETLLSRVGGKLTEQCTEGYDVRSPATASVIAHVGGATPQVVDMAVKVARERFTESRFAGLAERVRWCESTADLIAANAGSLAADLSEEQGKTISEARAEIAAGERGFRLAAECARDLDGFTPPVDDYRKRVVVVRQPKGVWAVLSPWNFPFNIPIEYLGPALATGSPVVWKPAPTCPRIASRLIGLMSDAGVPEGLVNLILTGDVAVAEHLVTHPGIDAVGLTGGTGTGDVVAREAWDKYLLLELGGNGPIVVLDDADLSIAAPAAASSAFANAGQVCSAAGRILVANSVADEFTSSVTEFARHVVVGLPTDPTVTMGPVHAEAVAETMDRHIRDAVERGARLITGGERLRGLPTDLYYAPTVLDGVPEDSQVASQETFGPIAPVIRCQDDDALLAIANSGTHGLVAAVFTESLRRAWRFAERLETGSVVVNDTSNYWELHLPFGGRAGRSSGRGRLGGRSAIQEFTQLKTISFDVG